MEPLTDEEKRSLYEWTLEKPLFWLVMMVTCFLGLVQIFPSLPSESASLNWFFALSVLSLATAMTLSTERIIHNLYLLEQLERDFSAAMKGFLRPTTSLPQAFLFGRDKEGPVAKRTRLIRVILAIQWLVTVALGVLKFSGY